MSGIVNVNTRLVNFIEKSIKSHTIVYDYSKVNYINGETEVSIICSDHGEFLQKPNVNSRGSDCPSCSRKRQVKKKSTTESFITKANLIHNNFYNYDKTLYTCSKNKVIITCPIHR